MKKLDLHSDIFTRGVDDIVARDELTKLLDSKKQLRIKYGVDVTAGSLHIGHAVNLWAMRKLQEYGHKVIFLIGDFTTQIGDPTGRSETRKKLSITDIDTWAKGFIKQVGHVLLTDKKVFEVRKNSEWYGRMNTQKFLELLSLFTHAQLIQRDMFQRRIKEHKEIIMPELLYPILQGYDSVMLKSDMTIIGSDQLFNEKIGRVLQEKFRQSPQILVTTTITPGLDGGPKMSKSLGNYIGLNDAPGDKFGKAMRLLDALIVPYLEVYTDMPMEQIARIKTELKAGMNPRDAKLIFAETLVERYHGEAVALKAREQFLAVFSKKELPEEIEEIKVRSDNPVEILVETGFASSKSDARRLLKQGGVEVDGKRLNEKTAKIEKKNGALLRVGKRKIARLMFL